MFVLTEKAPVYKFCIHPGDWLIKSSISGNASFSQILAKARAVLRTLLCWGRFLRNPNYQPPRKKWCDLMERSYGCNTNHTAETGKDMIESLAASPPRPNKSGWKGEKTKQGKDLVTAWCFCPGIIRDGNFPRTAEGEWVAPAIQNWLTGYVAFS